MALNELECVKMRAKYKNLPMVLTDLSFLIDGMLTGTFMVKRSWIRGLLCFRQHV